MGELFNMNSKNFMGMMLGLVFILFIMGINGVDFGLLIKISSNRLGIFLLFLVSISYLYKSKFHISISSSNKLLLILLILISFFGYISMLFSPYQFNFSVLGNLRWILIGLSFVFISHFLFSSNIKVIS